jgi:predicted Fe-S protein YdhL (DUF1289 family)
VPEEIPSPCNKICTIEVGITATEVSICTGCGRTLDEIAGWSDAGPDERLKILAQLDGRLHARRMR